MKPNLALASIILISIAASKAATVTIPFSTNFDSYAVNDSVVSLFTETNVLTGSANSASALSNANGSSNSSFVDLGGGDIALRQSIAVVSGATSGSNGSTSAALSHANSDFVTAGGFLLSTTFTIDSYVVGTGSAMNVSLNAFSTSASFGDGYRLIYTLSGTAGTLSLQQSGGTLTSVGINPLLVPNGSPITLTLQGLFSGTTLNLIGTASNSGGSVSISGVDTPDSPTGNTLINGSIFGVRSALASPASPAVPVATSETITFTALGLSAVPEPTSAMMFAFAAGIFGLRRKRA